jgi:hypothetical protein
MSLHDFPLPLQLQRGSALQLPLYFLLRTGKNYMAASTAMQ